MNLKFNGRRTGLFLALASFLHWLAPAWAQQQPQNPLPLPRIEFSEDTYPVKENARAILITIRRTGPTNTAAAVEFATQNGTAVAGENYVAKKATVSFPPGQVEQTVQVQVRDDFRLAGNKSAKLVLSNPAGAELGDNATAELLIEDNDSGKAALLTFGLDRIPFLHHALFDIPIYQYIASLIYIFLAFYISKLLDFLISGRLKRWAERTQSRLDDLFLELVRGPIKVVSFVILLHIGLRLFPWQPWLEDFFSKGLKVVVAISITYMVVKGIDILTGFWKQRAAETEDKSFNEQLLPIIRKTLKVFAVVVAVLLTLQNLGLNITSLLTSLGIGGLALALAAQDTLANFFGAIVILVDKPFRIGDAIQIDTVTGTVESIGFRSTQVRNLDGHQVSIPNKTVGNAIVTNISKRPNIRTLVNLGLAYDTPAEKVLRAVQLLEETYRNHAMTHDVLIGFNKFGDSALNISVVHWWKGLNMVEYTKGFQDLNLSIKRQFEAEAIGFAFPSQTVYLKQDSEWRVAPTDRQVQAPPSRQNS
ncbi:MAG: Low conductance mechanosensitive channel YnaI [Verrucomicrobiales bacterium]|nr:Low conductance mechanosensitive channel YnaI [Verrucomicrobiales bacterium]